MRKKNLTKDQREIQIVQWFAARIQDYNDNSLASLAQIGRGIGISPSSHLRKICETLVNRKVLVARKLTRSGRWEGRGYRLRKSAWDRPATRNVTVNFVQNGIRIREELLL